MVPTPTLKVVTIYSERIRGTFLRMLGNCPKLGEEGGGLGDRAKLATASLEPVL